MNPEMVEVIDLAGGVIIDNIFQKIKKNNQKFQSSVIQL